MTFRPYGEGDYEVRTYGAAAETNYISSSVSKRSRRKDALQTDFAQL